MDYYGPMRRHHRLIALALLITAAFNGVHAASPATTSPNNSNLGSELFYQLLVGELSAQSGDTGSAYSLMLDAARKANSPRLYERAVELALLSRSGTSALDAAQAWARAFPASREANRYVLQILIGLNRIADTLEPLKRELAGLRPAERSAAIGLLPRYYARATERKLVATIVDQALKPDLVNHTTGPTAWSALGILRLQAADASGALEAARRGAALDPQSEVPMMLALALMEYKIPEAEVLVRKYVANKPRPDVRMAYARHLLSTQRFAEAYAQMELLTAEKPDYREAWLVRGSLEYQDKKMALAETSLKSFVALNPPAPGADTDQPAAMDRGLVQAYLLLAQIAEQDKRLDEAQSYLARITGPQDALRVQSHRATILARQGKLDEARAVIRNTPESQPGDARAKVSAEVQLLRDNKQFLAAYQLLGEAVVRFPEDADLAYDQAMLAEKVGKQDEMEQLLRRVIAAKPDYHHAYNALGYSLADRNVRLPEARQLVAKALEFAPNDPFIVDSLAWVEFRSGNPAEAVRLLQGAFQVRPDAEIAAHLGEVLWSLGQRDQANAIWTKGLELNAENETLQDTIKRLRGKP